MTIAREAVWTAEDVKLSGATLRLRKGGTGDPLLLLHHDVGSLDRLPFYDALARRFTVYLPSHPGYDGTERPTWLRSVRDIAAAGSRRRWRPWLPRLFAGSFSWGPWA